MKATNARVLQLGEAVSQMKEGRHVGFDSRAADLFSPGPAGGGLGADDAAAKEAEESDEENDHEQDREQRLESNADPSVEGALIEDDSQKRNFVRKSSSALSLLSMSPCRRRF